MDSVLACMPSRSGSPEWGPFEMMKTACRRVAEIGIAAACAIAKENKYGVAQCRNMAVAEFLTDKDCTHLFFVDDDVYVPENAIFQLLEMRKDVAAGCYPSIYNVGELKVETYVVAWEDGKKIRKWFKGIKRVEAAGTGCMLIHRRVFDKIKFPWFRWGEYLIEGKYQQQSDDLDFCHRCRERGIEIWANGNVRCGHVKPVDIANFVAEEN
jgi:GT2 family glycosyltransferase